jgi:beta-lactam-binding protein with PASTA domain
VPGPQTPGPTGPTAPEPTAPTTTPTPETGTPAPEAPAAPGQPVVVPAGSPAQPQAARCLVPRLRGATVAKARAALRRAACKVGAVRRVKGRGVARGRVLAQSRRAGRTVAAGTRVDLRVRR